MWKSQFSRFHHLWAFPHGSDTWTAASFERPPPPVCVTADRADRSEPNRTGTDSRQTPLRQRKDDGFEQLGSVRQVCYLRLQFLLLGKFLHLFCFPFCTKLQFSRISKSRLQTKKKDINSVYLKATHFQANLIMRSYLSIWCALWSYFPHSVMWYE